MKSPSSPSPPSSPWLDAPTIASVSRREDGRRRAAWIAGGAIVVGIVAFVLAHRAGATAEPAPTDVTGSNAIEQDAQSDFPGVALAPPPSNASAAPSTTYRVPPPPLPPDPGEVAAEKSALEKPLEKPEKPERSADPPRPPRNPKPLPRPPPPKNCDPPFRIEADGHKRYIPECLK